MSRKHYVAIANEIKQSMDEARSYNVTGTEVEVVTKLASRIADVMSNDNPNFDYARFLKACGVRA